MLLILVLIYLDVYNIKNPTNFFNICGIFYKINILVHFYTAIKKGTNIIIVNIVSKSKAIPKLLIAIPSKSSL